MTVYFSNELGVRSIIAKNATHDEVWAAIKSYLSDNFNFTPYYYRHWLNPSNPKETVIDYGSHSCFFYLLEED